MRLLLMLLRWRLSVVLLWRRLALRVLVLRALLVLPPLRVPQLRRVRQPDRRLGRAPELARLDVVALLEVRDELEQVLVAAALERGQAAKHE